MRVVAIAGVLCMVMLSAPAAAEDVAWLPSLPSSGVNFYSVSLFDDGVGYVYNQQPEVPGSHLLRTTDGGVTYNRVTSQGGSLGWVQAMEFASPSRAYAFASSGVFKSTDAAATFSQLDLPRIDGAKVAYHALSVGESGAVGVAGRVDPDDNGCGVNKPHGTAVFTSDDGGQTWSTFRLAYEARVRDLVVGPSETAAMITHGASTRSEPGGLPLLGGCAGTFEETGPGAVWLADAEQTFHPVLDCGTIGCTQVARPTHDRVVVAMGDGSLRVSNDAGGSFTTVAGAAADAVSDEVHTQALEFTDATTGWLSTGSSGIYRTDDGGLTWTEEVSPQHVATTGRGDLAVTRSGRALVGGPLGVLRRVPLG